MEDPEIQRFLNLERLQEERGLCDEEASELLDGCGGSLEEVWEPHMPPPKVLTCFFELKMKALAVLQKKDVALAEKLQNEYDAASKASPR